MKSGRNVISVCLFLMLFAGLFTSITPQVLLVVTYSYPGIAADSFITEISVPYTALSEVDVDSKGNIFINSNNTVWRSTDGGLSWTKVLDNEKRITDIIENPYNLFIDSRDYIHTQLLDIGGFFDQYRSTDGGNTWIKTMDNIPRTWFIDEASNGSLYMNNYYSQPLEDYIYKSNDYGVTWSVWYNITDVLHIHSVQVNDYSDAEIFVATGDAPGGLAYRYFNGTSWIKLTSDYSAIGIWFDENYVYWGHDGHTSLWRIPLSDVKWENRELVFDVDPFLGAPGFVWDGARFDDIMLFGTDGGQVWGSLDGERWVKIFEDATGHIKSFSRRRPIYFTDRDNNKLYRFDIQKEDLIRLYYTEYNLRRGSVTNAENYVLEQRISNGTNYVDLTSVALSDVQATIKGLSKYNKFNANAGWEWNNKTGWTEDGGPLGTITSVAGEVANGSYAYKVIKNVGDTWVTNLRQSDFTIKRGDIVVASAYLKGNQTGTNALEIRFTNATSGTALRSTWFTVTTSWQRVNFSYVLKAAETLNLRVFFEFEKVTVTHYLDSVLVQVFEVGIAYNNGTSNNAVAFFEGYQPSSYFTGQINTQNPNLTISGQTVSHSGTLTNGTASSATSLSGILTGAIEVDANIEGSGQAILKITGTRILYEDSIILQGRTSDVYYGRYYGTFSPTTTTSDLIAVTNLASNITSLSYDGNKLTLIVDSPSGTTSTTKVYCGIRGEPIAIYTVNGTLTWSYNTSTTILTLNVTHTSPTRILVYWKFPGDTDSDGDVDIHDLYILAVAYGSHVEEPNYNSDSDIDGNNHVNSDDLYILAEDYGELQP